MSPIRTKHISVSCLTTMQRIYTMLSLHKSKTCNCCGRVYTEIKYAQLIGRDGNIWFNCDTRVGAGKCDSTLMISASLTTDEGPMHNEVAA